jgi:hypothetical protein
VTKLSLASCPSFCELPADLVDGPLRAAATACIELQKSAAADLVRSAYTPDRSGGEPVSKEALDHILASNADVRGIATERDITNAIPFNIRSVERTVKDQQVIAARKHLDDLVSHRMAELFERRERPLLFKSGQYWYPRGGYMGWHTNNRYPGWRLYVSYAAEPGKSFFRYRRPEDGEIVTSLDTGWNVRLFEVNPARPLWHAVWSETDRFSFGYVVRPWSLRHAVTHRLGL